MIEPTPFVLNQVTENEPNERTNHCIIFPMMTLTKYMMMM